MHGTKGDTGSYLALGFFLAIYNSIPVYQSPVVQPRCQELGLRVHIAVCYRKSALGAGACLCVFRAWLMVLGTLLAALLDPGNLL